MWSKLEVYIPDPTRKSGSLACDYVGSGSGSDFNFRVEIGFKVIIFKFSFGNNFAINSANAGIYIIHLHFAHLKLIQILC